MQIGRDKKNQKGLRYNQKAYIPFIFDVVGLLAAIVRWNASPTQSVAAVPPWPLQRQ
jgi:hypothetical protein